MLKFDIIQINRNKLLNFFNREKAPNKSQYTTTTHIELPFIILVREKNSMKLNVKITKRIILIDEYNQMNTINFIEQSNVE